MVDTTLSPRNLALTFLIVALFTGLMFWLNRSDIPLGYARYDSYGISLVYPKYCYVQTSGLSDLGYGSEASDFAGVVQWQSNSENNLNIFEVIWLVGERSSNPQADLKAMTDKASSPNNIARLTGDFFTSTLQGEEVECSDLEVVNGSYVLSGVVCVAYRQWSSPGTDRLFFVVYATLKDSVSQDQIRADFQKQLNDLHLGGL